MEDFPDSMTPAIDIHEARVAWLAPSVGKRFIALDVAFLREADMV
jgi:hypothetical protein